MPRNPCLHIGKPEMTDADRAYCTALSFIQSQLAVPMTVELDADTDRYGVPTPRQVMVSPFSDPHPGSVALIFEFKSADDWGSYYRSNSRVAHSLVDRTEAITHSYDTHPRIGVNQAYHTYGTLVHESFHYFSHADFRRRFTSLQNEGCTEFLARKAMGKMGPRHDRSGHGDFYSAEMGAVQRVIDTPEDVLMLVRAYVLADDVAMRTLEAFFRM